MPKAIPIISAFHNLSAGELADEHGQLCAQIADLEPASGRSLES